MKPRPAPLPAGLQFLQRDWLSSNQVLLFDDDGGERRATLVDAGYVKHAAFTVALVRRALQQRGMSDRQLPDLLNTHLHSDHCGGNAALRQAFGCRVRVPQAEFEAVRRWDEDALTFRATGQRCARFAADDVLQPGEALTLGGTQWRVLAAPGHDPHSLILHCPEHRVLMSADALWENGFGIIFPELEGKSGFAEQRAVLDLIAGLEVDTVLPGHGAPFADVEPALERAYARLDAMQADPVRNARNALRVLIKFLLLEHERTTLDQLVHLLRDATVIHCAAQLTGRPLPQALEWGITELARQGALRTHAGGVIENA